MPKEMLRQGGRSARIQEAVHRTVADLLESHERSAITIPMIAERAGVTPSTIYRRWGDISEVFADVSMERMRPIADPADTGSLAGDLDAFIADYAEEMASDVGRKMISDVLSSTSPDAAAQCCYYTRHHLQTLDERAQQRGEGGLDVDGAMDRIISPVMYHILFRDREVTPHYCRRLVANFVAAK